jgi:hypothetical protein
MMLHTPDGLTVSPNPAGSVIRISMPSDAGDLIFYQIYDLNGRKTNLSGAFHGVNISGFEIPSLDDLMSGIYILKITTQNSQYSVKFVKK